LIDFKDRKLTSTVFCIVPYKFKNNNNDDVQQCLNKAWIPARTTQIGIIRSSLTEPTCVTRNASIDRDAVGLSDGKVATSTVDVVIIIDEVGRAEVIRAGQTVACLVRGGFVKRALGGILSRAQSIIG